MVFAFPRNAAVAYYNTTHDILSHMLCNAPLPPPSSLSLLFYLRMGQGLQLPIDLHFPALFRRAFCMVYILKPVKQKNRNFSALRWLCITSTYIPRIVAKNTSVQCAISTSALMVMWWLFKMLILEAYLCIYKHTMRDM